MTERLDEPDLVVLARVLDRGSFARAAEELRVPPSTLSRRIAALERRLGVRALERTTRQLRATEVGELLAERGRRVRAELDEAERLVADHRKTPRGVLRVSIQTPAGDFLGLVVADVLARYPELRLEIVASDRPLDVIAEGADVALHVGPITAGHTLGVTRLGQIAPVLAATRRYLDRAPPLRHPRDLADPGHTLVRSSRQRSWEFVHGKTGALVSVTPPASRALVSTKMLAAAVIAHDVGLALIPRTAVDTYADLVVVEPGGYRPTAGPLWLVTPSARTAAPKVRAFADAMRAYVAARPDLFR